MTTMNVYPDPATGTMKLIITKTATVTSLIRADVNGTRPVRTYAGVFPSAGAGSLTLTDYEAAQYGPVAYRLDGLEVRASFGPNVAPRFTLPFHPDLSIGVELVTAFNGSRPQAATVHEIVGREDPIVVQSVMKSRRGSLEIILDSYDQAADLETMLKLGKVCMYRQSENRGQDFYFHALTTEIEPDETCWKVTVNYVAVRPPSGNRASGNWTFAALAALPGASFATVAGSYDSFSTLTIGQQA